MENREVQPGFRSGLLEVVAEAPRVNGRKMWHCRCDCGGEKIVPEHHLKTEHTKSCGCLVKRRTPLLPNTHIAHLMLLEELPRKNGSRRWLCRCDCGEECVVQESHIKSGHTKSCGCLSRKTSRSKAYNLHGQQFDRLKVVGHKPKRINGVPKWFCRCACGNELYVEAERLISGRTKSCGCLRDDKRKENFQQAIHHVDGTCIEKIANPKETAVNTSGHRGVYPLKNGKFRASITFRGKRYDLGTHKTFEEAVEARLLGEKIHFGEYLENYYAKQKDSFSPD